MGAWGSGIFENDDALDLKAELDDGAGAAVLGEAFQNVLGQGANYLETPDASRAIAAAQVVAWLQGMPPEAPADGAWFRVWSQSTGAIASADLVRDACRSVERVLAPQSELRDLWEESDEFEAWLVALQGLQDHLCDP